MSLLGPKYTQLIKLWSPTLGIYAATAGCGLIYFTDWKVVARYIPYYGGKFKTEDT